MGREPGCLRSRKGSGASADDARPGTGLLVLGHSSSVNKHAERSHYAANKPTLLKTRSCKNVPAKPNRTLFQLTVKLSLCGYDPHSIAESMPTPSSKKPISVYQRPHCVSSDVPLAPQSSLTRNRLSFALSMSYSLRSPHRSQNRSASFCCSCWIFLSTTSDCRRLVNIEESIRPRIQRTVETTTS